MTPTGRFSPRARPGAGPALLRAIAAGSGITPVLSIVATVLEVEPESTVTLVYGNRTAGSVMFLEELADLKDRYPDRFRLVHVLSREQQEVELFSGRLDPPRLRRLLEALLPPETVDEWFLCGPFAMVEGAREVLAEAGVGAAHVHAELFHVEGEAPRESASPRARSGRPGRARVTVDPRRARHRRVQVPRTGVADPRRRRSRSAPTRRTPARAASAAPAGRSLVSGEVAMARNYALEPDEVEAGFVLACQSVPVSEEVVLDFDA